MDVKNEFWQHATWIDFFKRKDAQWSDVIFFVKKYSDLLNFSETEYNQLYEEFFDYSSLFMEEVTIEDAVINDNDNRESEYRMDTIWYNIQNLKSCVGENYRFNILFKVAHIALITPHSNAGIERVYSVANKNKPEGSDRNRMDIDNTLSSILAVKLARPEQVCSCYNFVLSERLIKSAKTATTRYIMQHQSK